MDLLTNGPGESQLTLLLAHGAGTPMAHPFLTAVAEGIAESGFRVARFEFPYMAARRAAGKSRPPDREPVLLETFRQAFGELEGRVVIGGKSMGGRMASTVADELGAAGLLVFGYPFHPPGRPERLRVAHLEALRTSTLIIQGSRDPFGGRQEVETYTLSPAVRLEWIDDAGHDLVPSGARKKPLRTQLQAPITHAIAFLERLAKPSR